MKILFCGDVVGRAGRDKVCEQLPDLREQLELDFVVVNGENAAGGFGITADICRALYQVGADVVTLGNHAWDQRETLKFIDGDPKLIRANNYPPGTPGRGGAVYTTQSGKKIYVLQVMCRLFMDALDDPFASVRAALERQRLGGTVDAIVLDIHGEATSEKQALARYVDGQVSLAVGTHTHVPTADHQILPKGTAFMTDVGMCGAYNSIIGMEPDTIIERFTRKIPTGRFTPVMDDATLAAVYVETDDQTGLASYVAPLRVGGTLEQRWPV